MDTTLEQIAQHLRELAARSPSVPQELEAWNSAATDFKKWLSAQPAGILDQVPHFVWHYLDDADIRCNDEIYRRNQEQELAAVLNRLEGGDSPEQPRTSDSRPLTRAERELARWMLEHGNPGATAFLPQLEKAQVLNRRCPCGCASFDLEIAGLPIPTGGLRTLGDYVFGDETELAGAFIFERDGVLAGVEVYGMTGDAPRELPTPESLRPFHDPESNEE